MQRLHDERPCGGIGIDEFEMSDAGQLDEFCAGFRAVLSRLGYRLKKI